MEKPHAKALRLKGKLKNNRYENKNIHLVPYFNPVFYECPKEPQKFGG